MNNRLRKIIGVVSNSVYFQTIEVFTKIANNLISPSMIGTSKSRSGLNYLNFNPMIKRNISLTESLVVNIHNAEVQITI
jgi:hypothetical protein